MAKICLCTAGQYDGNGVSTLKLSLTWFLCALSCCFKSDERLFSGKLLIRMENGSWLVGKGVPAYVMTVQNEVTVMKYDITTVPQWFIDSCSLVARINMSSCVSVILVVAGSNFEIKELESFDAIDQVKKRLNPRLTSFVLYAVLMTLKSWVTLAHIFKVNMLLWFCVRSCGGYDNGTVNPFENCKSRNFQTQTF